MKKTIVLALLILLGYLVTDSIVFLGLRYLDKNVYTGQTSGKVNQFLGLKDSVNTLVFGSSRANHHIDILELDSSAFNMGVDATKIGYAAALIETLTKKNQQIFVHIDQNSLLDPDNSYTGKDCLSLINLVDREEGIRSVIEELFPEELSILKISKSYAYNGKTLGFFKNYFKPSYDYKKYHGYDPLVPNETQKEVFLDLWNNKGRDSIGYNHIIGINPLVEKLIDRIKKKCLENESSLVFFTSPTLNHINPALIERTQNFFESKNIRYYDYTYVFNNFNPEYWKDFTHLSARGANQFTLHLKSNLTTYNKKQMD
ncbi:hypothetical protein [Ascidiimonas sp. W6]|uniref:hypothetical protein n=1 Tax=Ascidiimonas meishanensis TaxID=3128903 RepID=UPI0030EC46BD